jgi:protein TonB
MESTLGFSSGTYTAKKDFYLEEPSFHEFVIMDETPKPVVEPVQPKERPPIKQVTTLNSIKEVPNTDTREIESTIPSSEIPLDDSPSVSSPVTEPVDTKPKSIIGVEFVPVFPGCESLASNSEKIACMSEKIKKFIGNRFNTDDYSAHASGKPQRIDVEFKIDAFGNVTDIKARAKDNILAEEAQRVVNKLPKMQPGRQGGRNVEVMYYVPITVIIE